MHGETTSEKNAFGHFVDGKVTAVLEHIHIYLQLMQKYWIMEQHIKQMLE